MVNKNKFKNSKHWLYLNKPPHIWVCATGFRGERRLKSIWAWYLTKKKPHEHDTLGKNYAVQWNYGSPSTFQWQVQKKKKKLESICLSWQIFLFKPSFLMGFEASYCNGRRACDILLIVKLDWYSLQKKKKKDSQNHSYSSFFNIFWTKNITNTKR